jgi:glycosyltransferase involved in cell wall biosynthesis
MKKILVLHYIPTPHRNYQFNLMNELYKKQGIGFKVAFLSKTDKNRDWNKFDIQFDYEILKNFAIRVGRKDLYTFFINTNILDLLNRERPDKIICFGWDNFASYISLLWCKWHKKKFIMWSGSTDNEKSWRRTLFNPLVKFIVKHSDECVGDGTRHRNYLIKLGADPKHTHIFYYQIDVDYFEKRTSAFKDPDKKAFKKQLGINTSKLLIFNGQLIERKGIFELLEAFANIQKSDSDISLLMLGRGREQDRLLKIITDNHIRNVFFPGFVQYDEVYKYFAISDMLVIPSREEAWGLVINEAMACGLPVITTDKVGACDDMIQQGKNGYVIPTHCSSCIECAILNVYELNLYMNNSALEKVRSFPMEKMIREAGFLQFN